jgi:quaternary ammonium compound-resistance protein SugE
MSTTHSMAWLLLVIAGVLEVIWATSMKASAGFSKLPLTVLTIVVASASFALLGLAMKSLPVGTAYAVWVGIGAVGAAALGILLFNEPVTPLRIGCIGLIVAGVVGLRFSSGH